jgi:hypothetical protein
MPTTPSGDELERQRFVEQLDFRENPENSRWSEKFRRALERE